MAVDPGWVIGLTVIGGSCELIGIALVVKEIADDRALVRDLEHEDARSVPQVGPAAIPQGPLSRFFRIDWDEITQVNRKEFRSALDDAVSRLIAEDRARDHELRAFLHKQLTGSITGRVTGVAFFAAGIVLASVAQILQFIAD